MTDLNKDETSPQSAPAEVEGEALREFIVEYGRGPDVGEMKPAPRFSPRIGRFHTCTRHGWDCWNSPCPKCKSGDAPRHCSKHGWSHTNKGCPACQQGQ